MLEEILSDTETMKTLVMSTFASAQQEGREDVANFMAERQEGLGKYYWQLKATLKDSRA
jgi:DNA-binding ferritin-like protein